MGDGTRPVLPREQALRVEPGLIIRVLEIAKQASRSSQILMHIGQEDPRAHLRNEIEALCRRPEGTQSFNVHDVAVREGLPYDVGDPLSGRTMAHDFAQRPFASRLQSASSIRRSRAFGFGCWRWRGLLRFLMTPLMASSKTSAAALSVCRVCSASLSASSFFLIVPQF